MADATIILGTPGVDIAVIGLNDDRREAPVTDETYASSDEGVFTVNGGGVAVGVTVGTATLEVSAQPEGDVPALEDEFSVEVITAATASARSSSTQTQTNAVLNAARARATSLRIRAVRIVS